MPELSIDFQGVIAFNPNERFANNPTRIDVVLPDLVNPDAEIDDRVGTHHAWLEFPPETPQTSRNPPPGIGTVHNGFTSESRRVLLLDRQAIGLRIDGQRVPETAIAIDQSVLDHLAVYQGVPKRRFRLTFPLLNTSPLIAGFRLSGGSLRVTEVSDGRYNVPLHHGSEEQVTVATALTWNTPFDEEVALRFRSDPTRRSLRFRPTGDLRLAIRNRELDQLLTAPPAFEGIVADDEEFLVYGNLIEGGTPSILRAVGQARPGGAKACGTGGIQG